MEKFKVYTTPENCFDCGGNEKLARKLFYSITGNSKDALLVIEIGTDVYYIETVWSDGFTSMKQVAKLYHMDEVA